MKYERITQNTLRQLEITENYAAYHYISYGVEQIIKDHSCLDYITKSLYIKIAERFQTSWTCVERDIRTVVNVIWEKSDQPLLKLICNGKEINRPTNKKFFQLLTDYILIYTLPCMKTDINSDKTFKKKSNHTSDCVSDIEIAKLFETPHHFLNLNCLECQFNRFCSTVQSQYTKALKNWDFGTENKCKLENELKALEDIRQTFQNILWALSQSA